MWVSATQRGTLATTGAGDRVAVDGDVREGRLRRGDGNHTRVFPGIPHFGFCRRCRCRTGPPHDHDACPSLHGRDACAAGSALLPRSAGLHAGVELAVICLIPVTAGGPSVGRRRRRRRSGRVVRSAAA
ncbi:hypothetical protein SEVIR_5G458150v4 [Setaria viridis]